MSDADGRVLGAAKVVDSGSSAQRWDLVILGDGYTAGEMGKFRRDVDDVVSKILTTQPFDELRGGINIHRVDVASNESGATNLCDGTRRGTFFDSKHCARGIDRLLLTEEGLALMVAINAVPAMNATLMMVNSEIYGGAGGAVPTFSTSPYAFEIALHEMGHSHFGLADEYPSLKTCDEEGHARYMGPELSEPNVSIHGDGRRWSPFLTPGFPRPTTSNPNCEDCDSQPNPYPAETVGTFEGARHFRCGIYRPQFECRMRTLEKPFCAVCQDTIRRVLAPFLPSRGRRPVRRG